MAWQSDCNSLTALLITGGTLAITGTYLLVTFAPHTSTHITAHLVQYYTVSWPFLLYLVSDCFTRCPVNTPPTARHVALEPPFRYRCEPSYPLKQGRLCSAANYLPAAFSPLVEKSNYSCGLITA